MPQGKVKTSSQATGSIENLNLTQLSQRRILCCVLDQPRNSMALVSTKLFHFHTSHVVMKIDEHGSYAKQLTTVITLQDVPLHFPEKHVGYSPN